MNFKVKHTDKFWNYYREKHIPHFLEQIRGDILRIDGCLGFNDSFVTIKDQTIKSKLIKTLFDM